MQIYLLKDLPGKGRAGDIINVNDGYGKNFLIKNGIGKAADNAVLSQVKAQQESAAFRKNEEITAIKALLEKLKDTVVRIDVKIGANGKMFGAVTGGEIAAALSKQGYEVDKKNFIFEPIKELGSYKVKIRFAHGLEGQFVLEVNSGN